MFCGQCGARTTPNASFCKDCGAPVRPAPVATRPLPSPIPSASARRRLTAAVVVTCGVVAALVTGWAVHLIPVGPSEAHGVGIAKAADGLDQGEEDAVSPTGSSTVDADSALTAFRTACGELLDIVPTAAVSTETAVQVTLEVRPVCPRANGSGPAGSAWCSGAAGRQRAMALPGP